MDLAYLNKQSAVPPILHNIYNCTGRKFLGYDVPEMIQNGNLTLLTDRSKLNAIDKCQPDPLHFLASSFHPKYSSFYPVALAFINSNKTWKCNDKVRNLIRPSMEAGEETE
jgi:hypothetical protein